MEALIITGLKHTGKSSLGFGLAKHFNIPFYDIDKLIEQQNATSVRNLFLTKGEDAFKQAEFLACQYIENAIYELPETNFPTAIISTGGGICDNEKAISLLKNIGKFLNLNVAEKYCFERIKNNAQRTQSWPAYISNKNPKNETEIQEIFHQFYTRRTLAYQALADFTFSPDGEASKDENLNNLLSFLDKTFNI